MNADPVPEKKRSITRLEILVGILALVLLVSLFAPPVRGRFSERGSITKGISNCRQICMALKLYAADHDGAYPDDSLTKTRSANAAFRRMFQDEIIDAEPVFGCPYSPFNPDGKIGTKQDNFKEAMAPGENHWMMTAGLSTSKPEGIPLVYENAMGTRWSPRWNADAKLKRKRGRTWTSGIIVGLNDGSVSLQPLTSDKGTAVGLKPGSNGEDVFVTAIDPVNFAKGEVLDIE
jgi:hypothetical protein